MGPESRASCRADRASWGSGRRTRRDHEFRALRRRQSQCRCQTGYVPRFNPLRELLGLIIRRHVQIVTQYLATAGVRRQGSGAVTGSGKCAHQLAVRALPPGIEGKLPADRLGGVSRMPGSQPLFRHCLEYRERLLQEPLTGQEHPRFEVLTLRAVGQAEAGQELAPIQVRCPYQVGQVRTVGQQGDDRHIDLSHLTAPAHVLPGGLEHLGAQCLAEADHCLGEIAEGRGVG